MRSKSFFLATLILTLALFSSPNISYCETAFDMMFKSSNKYNDVVIKDVLSTDTFRLKSGEKIKLIGLRALTPPKVEKKDKPERDEHGFRIKDTPDTPTTPLDEKAFEFTEDLLKGKHVRLEFDNSKRDANSNTLAYAFLLENDVFVNTEILRHGYAHLQIRFPNKKYADKLRDAYKEARREMRGLQGE